MKKRTGLEIRELRAARGWSIRVLADRAGVHPNAILRMENGETSPRQETVAKLLRALGEKDDPELSLAKAVDRLAAAIEKLVKHHSRKS